MLSTEIGSYSIAATVRLALGNVLRLTYLILHAGATLVSGGLLLPVWIPELSEFDVVSIAALLMACAGVIQTE